MDILYRIGSVVLLLVGALYPLLAIYSMMQLFKRSDGQRPSSMILMLRFILIATMPVAGILGGFAGFAPTLWSHQVIRVIVYGATILSIAAIVMLAISSRSQQSS